MFVCVVVCVVFDTGYFARGGWGMGGGGGGWNISSIALGLLEDFFVGVVG